MKYKEFFRRHRAPTVLMGIVLVLTTVPVLGVVSVLGNTWKGITPTFIDETLYQAHIHAIGEGYVNDGNPYFLEHRYDPPLVIFGGAWINALPMLAGLSLNTTLLINFVLWSLVFAALFYWLFRKLRVPPWIAVLGTLLQYLQFYPYLWRSVNLQPVLPVYILFSIAFVRLLQEQSRKNIYFLAGATGLSFYLYAYLWQTIVITLGLLFLYAFARKNWQLMKATLFSSFIGGIIGFPVPLYMLWLSLSSPYFLESISRFGLVNTHFPMAEVLYSGGWVGVILALLAVLYVRAHSIRKDALFIQLATVLSLTGLGLWIMQGSNLFTGKLLETGEHLRVFIFPWLGFATVLIGTYVWRKWENLTAGLRVFSFLILIVCAVVSVRYANAAFATFSHPEVHREFWQTQQLYAKPFAWLDAAEKDPVVVWSEPQDAFTSNLPIATKHFTLFVTPAMWELVSDKELRERYLVSQYFNNPTAADLKKNMSAYLGRQDAFHRAKSIERGIKICRIFFFWEADTDCGTPPTAISLLGETFFADLENRFVRDIKPNINMYLKKYHVSYIVKDIELNPQYHPEKLDAKRVYDDGRFQIYHLP